jgi:hypothetical protein
MQKSIYLVKFVGRTFQHPIHANTWAERMEEIEKLLKLERLTHDDILNITYQAN